MRPGVGAMRRCTIAVGLGLVGDGVEREARQADGVERVAVDHVAEWAMPVPDGEIGRYARQMHVSLAEPS